MSPWWLHSIYLSSPLLCKMSSLTQNMLFSYKKTLLSLIYQFSIGRFSYISFYVVNPPRVREKLDLFKDRVNVDRIIPASAGKTCLMATKEKLVEDHPRVCGKNWAIYEMGLDNQGSPPLLREKHNFHKANTSICRITPASAGKTEGLSSLWMCLQDHPRVCGKNRGIVQLVDVSTGSPPRLREK